jgi:transmembrane 9 superfamily member 3
LKQVGPYANPQEAYEYYTLPYCAPDTKHHPQAGDTTNKFNMYAFQSIGEHLAGHSLRHSGHDITFDFTSKSESCTTKPITEQQAQQFQTAIQHRWFYQMFLDDLPVWGMVGELLPATAAAGGNNKEDGSTAQLTIKEKDDLQRLEHVSDVDDIGNMIPYVYTTRNIIIHYNSDQIVQVDLTSDPSTLQRVAPGATYKFELHIQWEKTDKEFHSRFERYLDHEFFKHPIHWFSVFNSFMLVLFLIGLVTLILLRTLRKDYARFGAMNEMEEGMGGGGERDSLLNMDIDDDKTAKAQFGGMHGGSGNNPDEAGWKQVHGDVFRAPVFLPLFAALIGTGWQLVVIGVCVILFAVLGPLHGEVHEERGEVLHSVIICYSLSSIVAGYSSGQFFKMYYPTTAAARRLGAEKTSLWQAVMGLTVLVLPTFTIIIVSALNTVSLFYGTINSIPFLVIVKLFFIWICVSVPLTVIGTMLGRHGATAVKKNGAAASTSSGPLDYFPCRVNAIPRPIPEDVPWYGKPMGLIPLAGLLSFGSIFIELYYVLTSLWNYKYYHVYGFLLGVFGILVVVVSMTSVIVVYFCLNAENYHWQWTSFGAGASTAAYVFLYGVYYFLFKTHMHGFLQTMFYFGYMAMISTTLGILCGTLGHGASSRFVRIIFQNLKVD